jgi:hypothetical protein
MGLTKLRSVTANSDRYNRSQKFTLPSYTYLRGLADGFLILPIVVSMFFPANTLASCKTPVDTAILHRFESSLVRNTLLNSPDRHNIS